MKASSTTIDNTPRTGAPLISYSNVSNDFINGSRTANITYDINATASGTSLTINGGNGNDTFVMTPSTDVLVNIQGAVTLNAGAGGSTAAITYNINSTSAGSPLTVNGGSGANIFNLWDHLR
jgi:hypothetical protein